MERAFTSAMGVRPVIEFNVISGNTAESEEGGGIYCSSTAPIIRNNVIADNSSGRDGGGLFVHFSCRNAQLINNTIAGNQTDGEGGGIYSESTEDPLVMRNMILWGNTAGGTGTKNLFAPSNTVTYSIVEGAWPGTGNLNADPLFVNAASGDYHLQSASPGIDAGDPSDPFDREPEPNGSRINMGVYGNTPDATLSAATGLSVTALTPISGPPEGGTSVTITGSGFGTNTGTVTFDGVAASVVSWSDTQISVTTPAHDGGGSVAITITASGGGSVTLQDAFTYTGPALIRVPEDYSLIQTAINFAQPGDTIEVAPGTYNETNIDLLGRDVVVRSQSGNPEDTIIDAAGGERVFSVQSGETQAAVITGFTMRGGTYRGAGVYISNASPTISNCIIEDMTLTEVGGDGAGIHVNFGSPVIDGCIIRNNTGSIASRGGGIYLNNGDGHILNNIIMNNVTGSSGDGAGIYIGNGSEPVIEFNVISGNTAESEEGGGIYCSSTAPIIRNNVIADNSSGRDGGGLFVHFSCRNAQLINNTIAGNQTDGEGGGIYSESTEDPLVMRNMISLGQHGRWDWYEESFCTQQYGHLLDRRGGMARDRQLECRPAVCQCGIGRLSLTVCIPGN